MARGFGRRDFLSHAALTGVALGFSPASALARQFPAVDTPLFAPTAGDSDAAVFAAARKQFLFPTDVTYCNTGT
ncbi:MAG: twin-arginine translocation signal domain-containing protein, partial [Acidobacteriota bacterium]